MNRVYSGSPGLMMSAIAESDGLTREEIDELYKILESAEGVFLPPRPLCVKWGSMVSF